MMKGLARKKDRGKSALGGLALMRLKFNQFEFHSLQVFNSIGRNYKTFTSNKMKS